jgi:hypothetical protein
MGSELDGDATWDQLVAQIAGLGEGANEVVEYKQAIARVIAGLALTRIRAKPPELAALACVELRTFYNCRERLEEEMPELFRGPRRDAVGGHDLVGDDHFAAAEQRDPARWEKGVRKVRRECGADETASKHVLAKHELAAVILGEDPSLANLRRWSGLGRTTVSDWVAEKRRRK